MAWRSLGPALLALVSVLGPAVANAQQSADDPAREQARELGYAGVRAYQAGDYAGASAQLERAYELLPAPSLALWTARALVKLGKLVEGAERYQNAQKLPRTGANALVQQRAQLEAEQELALVLPRIPRVRFRLRDANASEVVLTVDDTRLAAEGLAQSRPINPGSHHVVALRGEQRVALAFAIAEGEEREVWLDFASPERSATRIETGSKREQPGSAARRNETLAWAGVGVGGAGIAFGTIAGLLALAKKNSLEDSGNCQAGHCSLSERDRVDSYNSLRTLSTIGFAAGSVIASAGVVLLVVSRKSHASAHSSPASSQEVELRLRATGAELSGRF